MRRIFGGLAVADVALAAMLVLGPWGCDSSPVADADASTGTDAGAPGWGELSHENTFESFDVASGEEFNDRCQSWTLDNDEELWITRVDQLNDGGFHHSNWFFVPEGTYDGPDGTWPCADRGFSTIGAGLAGGVFFAQSTQTTEESQGFKHGQALRIPPRARVVGQVHLLNAADTEIVGTALTFKVYTVPAEAVELELTPASFTNTALDIPPQARSRFHLDCDVVNNPDGFNLHYVLAHYHELGDYFALSVEGGERDGQILFELESPIGEPLGEAFDPPLRVEGGETLRMTCGYSSDRDEFVGYGIGDQEMCVALLYHDASTKFGATNQGDSIGLDPVDGIEQFQASCLSIGL